MIFYFSGTGNSLDAARQIADASGESVTDMAQALKSRKLSFRIQHNEKIGFVFPVYYSGVPSVVADFIKNVNIIADDCYVFCIITCGASAAGADVMARRLLSEINLTCDYMCSLKMPDNYVMLYNPMSKEEAPEALNAAKAEIINISEDINALKKGGYNSGIFGKAANGVMYRFYNLMRGTKKFYSDESCISCGLCEKVCPVAAVKITNGKPVWTKSKCAHCAACISRCPVSAIQYGSKTKNRTRYVNPVLE